MILPNRLALHAIDAAGLLDELLRAMRVSIVQDRGCVVVRSGGHLVAALPLQQWQDAIDAALKPAVGP